MAQKDEKKHDSRPKQHNGRPPPHLYATLPVAMSSKSPASATSTPPSVRDGRRRYTQRTVRRLRRGRSRRVGDVTDQMEFPPLPALPLLLLHASSRSTRPPAPATAPPVTHVLPCPPTPVTSPPVLYPFARHAESAAGRTSRSVREPMLSKRSCSGWACACTLLRVTVTCYVAPRSVDVVVLPAVCTDTSGALLGLLLRVLYTVFRLVMFHTELCLERVPVCAVWYVVVADVLAEPGEVEIGAGGFNPFLVRRAPRTRRRAWPRRDRRGAAPCAGGACQKASKKPKKQTTFAIPNLLHRPRVDAALARPVALLEPSEGVEGVHSGGVLALVG
ncbi:hypothetical protein K438DRAFT_1759289 [Mycena galopus ATCC 62051]|nr:hypothetical protein K438DRAFT_1759289 [Mycena galopus ATCC 62051]